MFVYVLQNYDQKLDNGTLIDSVEFQVISDSYDNAIKLAKSSVGKDNIKEFWRVSRVVQKDNNG